jgi:hypothetical protein
MPNSAPAHEPAVASCAHPGYTQTPDGRRSCDKCGKSLAAPGPAPQGYGQPGQPGYVQPYPGAYGAPLRSGPNRLIFVALGGIALVVVIVGALFLFVLPKTASWPTAEAAAQGLATKYGYTFLQSTTTDGKPEWSATVHGGSLMIGLSGQPGQPAELLVVITGSTYATEAENVLSYISPAAVTKAQGDITESASGTATVNYSHDVPGGQLKVSVIPSMGSIIIILTPTA